MIKVGNLFLFDYDTHDPFLLPYILHFFENFEGRKEDHHPIRHDPGKVGDYLTKFEQLKGLCEHRM